MAVTTEPRTATVSVTVGGEEKFFSNGLDLDWISTADDPSTFMASVHRLERLSEHLGGEGEIEVLRREVTALVHCGTPSNTSSPPTVGTPTQLP